MRSLAGMSLLLVSHTSWQVSATPRSAALISPHEVTLTLVHDSVLARKLRWAALDQQAALNLDSALALLLAARRADPSSVAAQVEVMLLRHTRFEESELHHESDALARSTDLGDRCLGVAMRGFTESRSALRQLMSLGSSAGSPRCPAAFLALEQPQRDNPDTLRLVNYARALRESPELQILWGSYAALLQKRGDWAEAERMIVQGQRVVRHPLSRAQLGMEEVALRVLHGDTSAALALRRSLRSAIDRDGRPGLLAVYDGGVCAPSAWGDLGERQELNQRRAIERPRARGDWAWVERTLINCGREHSSHGEPQRALGYLTRAIAIADSVKLPDLYLELYTQRGRAYLMLGRHADAERDLRRALGLGAGAGRLYNVADAHHNLAHVYEGTGRWAEASRAIDTFVALSRPMNGGLLFTGLIDAGEIRWKAGWHASARAAYEEMVRVTDEERREYFWAGEYYERIGDLQHAREYYEKARSEYGWNSRGQSGLARVYEKLGQVDSAEAVARVHDAQEALWPPLESPLLPPILARQGRPAVGLRIARDWAARQEQRGNVRGASLAFLQLSRLALDARLSDVALRAAMRAESLALILHLPTERIHAVTLRGRAFQRLGLRDSAVTTLRLAVRLASSDSATDNLFETNLALGDAVAERGQIDAALAAYDRAARATEHVTGSLVEDLDRARYRDRHLLPFDGAVQLLVRRDLRAARIGQLVVWSARRKAAALALATRDASSRVHATRNRASLGDVQRRLGEWDALVDYVVLDSVVAAIVITREHASLVRLPISKDSLRAMVDRLRHPLVAVTGGRIDLARAPFSLATAAVLHAALVRPLDSLLVRTRRLIIVPDGPLHALPFEALVVTPPSNRASASDYARAVYLIDAFEVEYLPSSSFLVRSETKRGKSLSDARLLVVSYGAPGAEQEAEALRAAWPEGRTTLLAGSAATERATKAAMARFGVIHFVVHANASARDPLASHLRLAPDSIEDSYLNLDEITAAKLNARLVVLSACETDAGPIYNGEGVMGLARAFLASGARAVVGTQWPVGPATADLMGEFYRRLARGDPASPSLRAAKLALRSQRETAHPFYWAGAVLVTGGGR